MVAATRNVAGLLLRFTRTNDGWARSETPMPEGGTVSLVATDEGEDIAFALSENPLTPQTLFALDTKANEPRAIKSLPALFNAEGMATRQYEATSSDGVKIPYFVIGRESVMNGGEAPTS